MLCKQSRICDSLSSSARGSLTTIASTSVPQFKFDDQSCPTFRIDQTTTKLHCTREQLHNVHVRCTYVNCRSDGSIDFLVPYFYICIILKNPFCRNWLGSLLAEELCPDSFQAKQLFSVTLQSLIKHICLIKIRIYFRSIKKLT